MRARAREAAEGVHAKEAEFHDAWADASSPERVPVREAFESAAAVENRFILSRIGDLRGKRVLDVGAGLGESGVYFALRGADVTCADLSPGMVEAAGRLARHHGVSVRAVVTAAGRLGVPDGEYDFVYASNLVHHVADRERLFAEFRRVLRPGGMFYSWDPLAYNPVINVYRRMATRVRTEDESPLTFADVAVARRHFEGVGHREFWVASPALFVKYYAVDGVHPNADRYWKRILTEPDGRLWWWKPLRASDAVLTRLPLVRRLAWNMVMWGRKPAAGGVAPGGGASGGGGIRTRTPPQKPPKNHLFRAKAAQNPAHQMPDQQETTSPPTPTWLRSSGLGRRCRRR